MNSQHIAIIVEAVRDPEEAGLLGYGHKTVLRGARHTIHVILEFQVNGMVSVRRWAILKFEAYELDDEVKLKKKLLDPERIYFKTEITSNASFDFKLPYSISVDDPGKILEWLKIKPGDVVVDTDYSEVPQKLLNQSQ